ncbi:hypothetical protein HDV06_004831 [Boothiomyces sp. JEL0866]|nr:hypothetical protein HDV06_004831 [Boothiomyces sp. JEL0866]
MQLDSLRLYIKSLKETSLDALIEELENRSKTFSTYYQRTEAQWKEYYEEDLLNYVIASLNFYSSSRLSAKQSQACRDHLEFHPTPVSKSSLSSGLSKDSLKEQDKTLKRKVQAWKRKAIGYLARHNTVLASGSPRRKEILERLGLKFTVQVSDFPENLPKNLAPQDYVLQTATAKTQSVYEQNKDALVIGADTVVILEDKILEKPSSKENAFEMLKKQSGKSHSVLTAVCLIKDGQIHSFVEKTLVTFGELTDQEILDYVATGEPMDKAGGYGYQGLGCTLVKSIEGCYYNVVGLPVYRLVQKLKSVGVEIGK